MIDKIKVAAKRRLRGGYLYESRKKLIQDKHTILDELDSIVCHDETEEIYVHLVKEVLNKYIKRNNYHMFIPNSLIPSIIFKGPFRGMEQVRVSDTHYKIRDIVLPIGEDVVDQYVFLVMIPDVILQYALKLDIQKDYKMYNMLDEGPYEYMDVALKKGDVVIDGGANVGDFTALAAAKGCDVYAFEPSNYIIDKWLSKTIELNADLVGKMILEPYALSDKKGEAQFTMPISNVGAGKLLDGNTVDTNITEDINMISLDDFVNERKISKIDFIKADIEGAERDMLVGAKNILKDFAPKLSICTYHLPDDPEVLEELILDANPKYKVVHKFKKLFAHI